MENEYFLNHKISQVGEQSDLRKLAREQMVLVKSTLKSVNEMLNDVSKNKVISGQGLKDIKNFVNKENREMKREYIETSMLVM